MISSQSGIDKSGPSMFSNKPAAQAAGQTLPDTTSPVGKIHPFSKIAVTLNQYSNLDALQDL